MFDFWHFLKIIIESLVFESIFGIILIVIQMIVRLLNANLVQIECVRFLGSTCHLAISIDAIMLLWCLIIFLLY